MSWTQSSFCDSGACVGVAHPDIADPADADLNRLVLVGNTAGGADEAAPFGPKGFAAFLAAAKAGEYDYLFED